MGNMPTVAGSFFKAVFCAAVAIFFYYHAQEVATVERTLIGGEEIRIGVDVDDDRVLEERGRARKKALPYYAGALVSGLLAFGFVRKSRRIHEKNKRRYAHDFTRPY